MMTRCMGCMAEYEGEMSFCPYCGYAEGTPVGNPRYLPPRTLLGNRYLLGRVVAVDECSITYVAWDTILEQRVAVREYMPNGLAVRADGVSVVPAEGAERYAQFVDGMRQFVEEAGRLARFQNEPGIVYVFGSFEANSTAYTVMEYLDGETLASYLAREGKVPSQWAADMLMPAIRSMERLHAEGVVHRDIAPDSIVLTRSGQIKLTGFGAARHRILAYSPNTMATVKPGYSPWEQYSAGDVSGPQTDVYALAGVLYTMVTGMLPPDAMERNAALAGKKGRDILVPPSKLAKVDKKLEITMLNALEPDPKKRTANAGELYRELSGQGAVRRVKTGGGGGMPKWAWIAIGAVVLLLGMLIGWLLLRQQGVFGNRPGDAEGAVSAGDASSAVDVSSVEEENMVSVPDVVNTGLEQAQRELQARGLTVVVVGTQATSEVAPDVVLSQTPAAGGMVEKGTVVQLVTSAPEQSEDVLMPDVTNSTQEEAANILSQQLGAVVTVQEEYSDEVAQGMVIRASLEPGAKVTAGDPITLYVSRGPEEIQVTPLSLNKKSITLNKGATYQLQASGGDGTYTWRVGNKKVATVKDGLVTAVGQDTTANTTRVFVSSGGEEAICYVTVRGSNQGSSTQQPTQKPTQQPTQKPTQTQYSVSLSDYNATISKVGRQITLVAYSEPQATLISWKSDNKSVATVNSAGRVTAVAPGTAKIIVTFEYAGGVSYTKTCTVTVKDG